jgi:hypothetical protein
MGSWFGFQFCRRSTIFRPKMWAVVRKIYAAGEYSIPDVRTAATPVDGLDNNDLSQTAPVLRCRQTGYCWTTRFSRPTII